MSVRLENTYPLNDIITPEDIKLALTGTFEGFKYYFEHCMLIQDRDTRQWIHPKMNAGQELMLRALFRHIDKETRPNKHVEFIVCGPRQFGKSTGLDAAGNYIEAYVPGMENLNLVHTLQQASAAAKYFKQKIEPIITNVHPAVFPTITRDTIGTSTLLKYQDIKGVPRGGYYEITSAGSNSVRSGTVSVWLCDEPSEYRNPEAIEDAISGAISSYGWSLTAYIGTFSDRLSDYFLNKLKAAIDNPNEIELVFIPWFLVYGREGDRGNFNEDLMTDYDRNVIIPEMIKYKIPKQLWLDKLGWYHRRALRTSKMQYEFPTSIEDIIKMTSDRLVFSSESIDNQTQNIKQGKCYRILTENATGKVEAHETDVSPFVIYKEPEYGHRYRICIDPITARSDESDNFVMQVMDLKTNEQVATFVEKDLQDEDYADWAVSIGTLYNKAQLCPEINVANGFVVAVNARRYYHWYYQDKKSKSDKVPGLRTTVSTKELFIDKLSTMLDRGTIIIHDEEAINELKNYVKKVKKRVDGSSTMRMEAKSGHHDDRVAALFIYAGSLDNAQIEGRKRSGYTFL